MKKFIALLIIFNFIITPLALSQEVEFDDAFFDSLIENLDKNLTIKKIKPDPIVDEFVINTLSSNLKINLKPQELIKDELLSNLNYKKLKTYKPVNFENIDSNIITIRPQKPYSTRNLSEGEEIYFYLSKDSTINNKNHKKGEIVKARVENITKNGAYGVPADFTIGNFVLVSNSLELEGEISKTGANRSLWVNPTAYVLSPFFGIGLLILPIRGGHAKLSPNKIYELNL